jgi:Flp pilus assembly protein TadG
LPSIIPSRRGRTATRTRAARRRLRDERGTGGVEFLMMITALMLLFLILVQFGINLYASRVAEAAAREGANEAAHWNGTAESGSAKAKSYVTDDGAPAVQGSTVSSSRTGTEARVTVTVQVATVLPFMSHPITSTATAPVERWTQ